MSAVSTNLSFYIVKKTKFIGFKTIFNYLLGEAELTMEAR